MTTRTLLIRSWARRLAFGLAVGGFTPVLPALAQEPSLATVSPLASAGASDGSLFDAVPEPQSSAAPSYDPINRVPNFFGDFFGRGSLATNNTITTQTISTTQTIQRPLTYTGGAEGFNSGPGGSLVINPPVTVTGPGGPFTLTTPISATQPVMVAPANENAELTGLVRSVFPGANFTGGTVTGPSFSSTFLLKYLFIQQFTTNQQITTGVFESVNLPNPAGGGLIGRNKYFENGSALPRDRVYFFYDHVGDYSRLGQRFDVNRYVLGGEKTFLDGLGSVEIRLPFAGTVGSDQTFGQGLAVDRTEFGNVGVLLKASIYKTANFILTAGMGVSLPTASDSRMLVDGQSILEIRNNAVILQPLLGVAWAPTDRFYAQAGLQYDFDPCGNPVYARTAPGPLSRAGILMDQQYLFTSAAVGYWIYQNDDGFLSRIALQGELRYDTSLGGREALNIGSIQVSDLQSHLQALTATAGAHVVLGDRAVLSLGVSFPLSDDRLYDWSLFASVNIQFGAAR